MTTQNNDSGHDDLAIRTDDSQADEQPNTDSQAITANCPINGEGCARSLCRYYSCDDRPACLLRVLDEINEKLDILWSSVSNIESNM